jgi:hypothetical protein
MIVFDMPSPAALVLQDKKKNSLTKAQNKEFYIISIILNLKLTYSIIN